MEEPAMTRRKVLVRLGGLLGALMLVGVPLGWWLLVPRDDSSTTGIESVRGTSGSMTLDVTYTAGSPGCAGPGGIQVQEETDEVRLTARTINRNVRPFSVTVCAAIGIPARTAVPLSAALGDRRVIDTTKDVAVPVQAPCSSADPIDGDRSRPKPGAPDNGCRRP